MEDHSARVPPINGSSDAIVVALRPSTTPSQQLPVAIAPATNGLPRPQDVAAGSMAFACVTCTRRKVKCDKTGPPCSTCRKTRLECHYEAPPPRKRKRKPTDDVQERLEHYENLLRQHGIIDQSGEASKLDNVGVKRPSPSDSTPSNATNPLSFGNVTAGDPAGSSRTGKLLAGRGKSRYIDSTLWRNLEELGPSSDEEEEEVQGQGQHGAAYHVRSSADPLTASMFASGAPGQSLLDLHPTYDAAMKCWRVYLSHVEPLTKLFHVPTATATVQRAAANPSSATKPIECLLFAIYHFATVAMTDEECQQSLGQDRAVLQCRYHAAVTQAFLNAAFLRTTDIIVVQAFVMFLLSIRNKYDPHTFWILTGVGVRLAQRIGLHRDGEDLGLKPFDVQVRRRLFWQLLPLDGMAAQLSGTGIALPFDSWDTKQPLNLDDEDIHPDMPEAPAERVGATDMLFCLLRTEMGKFHQKLKPFLGNWGRLWELGDLSAIGEMEAAIQEMETGFETKYMRYCDPVIPVHFLALLLGRGAPQNARLRLRLPRVRACEDVDENELRDLWRLAMRMFDYDSKHVRRTNPELKKFSWHLQAIFQWDCLIWVLNEIRRGSPAIIDPQEAWARIERMYTCHPQFLAPGRALHAAIRKLTMKAWDGQPAGWRQNGEPEFIRGLKAALAKRQPNSAGGSAATPLSANPWPPQETALNPPVENARLPAGKSDSSANASTSDFVGDFNAEQIDWTFWNTLIGESEGIAWR
ncbi:hypothetical protein B0A55_06840 [Friedmanniomyces simplex]|uniref:Zn(2)-C6 fungal-type domain-containing protein n=1 Tax=Friedmanniomyces simplex TaxID=329884 RepID=A0A4U0XC10_9PEZI|nr:hypothetical protein B0A55_06840 [Friedmanniomyces simplex]